MTVLSASAYAQTIRAKAGFNLSNFFIKDNDGRMTEGIKSIPSFHLGATAEFELMPDLFLETGLLYVGKGAQDGETMDYKTKASLHYLDIPLTAKMYFDAGSQRVFGTFGPYSRSRDCRQA